MEVEGINIDNPLNNYGYPETVVHVTPKLAQKRTIFPEEWKKNQAKKAKLVYYFFSSLLLYNLFHF